MGTTALAILGSILYPLADLLQELHLHGWSGMKHHWRERLKYSAAIAVSWWICLFCYHLFYKVPRDIRVQADNSFPPSLSAPPKAPSRESIWSNQRERNQSMYVTALGRGPVERKAGWRRLEDWQKVRLIATLSRDPNHKVLILASSGDETWAYAEDFRDVFLKGQWRVTGPESAPIDQAAMDIQLSISEKYWASQPPRYFEAVRGVMKLIGLKQRTGYVFDPSASPDELVLWVGAKSLDSQNPDNYLPLVMVETTCRHPLRFSDIQIPSSEASAPYARLIKIKSASRHFRLNDAVIVLLTGQALFAGTRKLDHIESLQKTMVRNDILKVTVGEDLNAESLDVAVMSDKDVRVRCVEDARAKQ
jgi:hypothetical protein